MPIEDHTCGSSGETGVSVEQLITEHLAIWTAADTEKKSGRGRSSGNAGSVYGIKKLRELIYELAATGKLVDHNNDESNQYLLGEVSEFIMGQAPLGSECNTNGDGVIFVKTGEFGLVFPEVKEWTTKPLKFAKKGDVLICVVGATIGKLNLSIDCAIGRSVAAIRPTDIIETKYLYIALTPFTLRLRERQRGSAQGVIGKAELSSIKIRVPSITEQRLIVAKVDELMALCDQLENQHNNAAKAHEKLVIHLFGTLTQSQNAEDFNTQWQRISEHFDTLFTSEASIDALKQTLLQLAVMGKLVPQDPNDEPASELLKRIQTEKAKLITDGKIKKDKPLAAIAEEEKPFDLPEGWEWVRKNEVFAFLNGYAFKSEWFESSGIKLLRNVNVSHGKATWSDPAYISIEQAANFNEYMLNVDDLVLSLDRPIITTGLKYAIISKADIPCLLLQRIAKVSSFCKVVNSEYLAIWLNSSFFVGNIDPGRSNGVPHISTTQVANMCFALPPTAEQWRIVAKVDELMAICDKLKSHLTAANQLQQKIANVLIVQTVN